MVWYFIIQQKLFTSKNFSHSGSLVEPMSLFIGLSIKCETSSHLAFLLFLHLLLSLLLHFLRLRFRLRLGFTLRPPDISWPLAMAIKSSSYQLTFTNTFIIHIIRRVGLLQSVQGLPFSTNAVRREGSGWRNGWFFRTIVLIGCVKCVQGEGGVKNPQNFGYVLYGSPLMRRHCKRFSQMLVNHSSWSTFSAITKAIPFAMLLAVLVWESWSVKPKSWRELP